MKATVTYECTEPGHEQRCVLTADLVGDHCDAKCEFDPPLSEDTSDPTGLLVPFIEMMKAMQAVSAL